MSNQDFAFWQKQYLESYKYGYITITQAIHILIKDGIIPFLLRFGYYIDISHDELGDIIATLMYHMSYDRNYLFPSRKNRNFHDEYFQDFEETINHDIWDSFWNQWNNILDNFFDYKNDGRFAIQIQQIVWMYIDMNNSLKIVQLNKEKEEQIKLIKEQEKLNKIDPYILDQINNRFIHPKFENN